MPAPGIQMNASQIRVVDPILSDHARGYSNAEMIGGFLFPTVLMPTRGVKRIEFGREAFRRRATRRAPGTPIRQVGMGYEGKPVGTHQEALQAVTPVEWQEDAAVTPGLDLQQESVDVVLAIIALEKEVQQAAVARNAASYDPANKTALAGADKFSDANSKPKDLIYDYGEVIRKRIGRRPNTLVMGGAVATALGKHPKILDHFKYTSPDSIGLAQLASYFNLPNVVAGDGIYDTDDATTVDIWGNDLILAYVPPSGGRNMRMPSYGYTYQLAGHPAVGAIEWDKDLLSWTNNVLDEFSAEMVGKDAGVLIQNAL